MKQHVVWTQWDDLIVPAGFTSLHPKNFPLESSDLSAITFYTPVYMSGRNSLEITRAMTNLEFLQVPNAGYDDALEFVRAGMTLCNAQGVHDASTSELAVGLAIAARRGFHDFAIAQSDGRWVHKRYPSLSDSRVAIIGYGAIGKELERKLLAFDVVIDAFTRSGKDGAKNISTLDDSIGTYDVIFLILPLNDESKNLFDKDRLAKMKTGATLINVARGPIVNTDALVNELNSGRICAGLDVTDPEPLPDSHPLWRAKNCIISPHVGGDSTAFESRGKKLVESQLAKLALGQDPLNIVARKE